jgi:hypothetical protein
MLIVLAFGALGDPGRERREELERMSRELLERSAENRETALDLASSYGWPMLGVTRDGRLYGLQGLERGFPFYYLSFNNTDAAITTRTDSVQHYAGGGSGFTIGLWDGDAPRTTHQELAGRIAWGDVKTLIPDDHATHVAGTMIASGVRPQARGMAPEAAIRAFQWDDDLAEMAAEAAKGLLVSNHSYGLIRGWVNFGNWYWFGDTAISEVEDYGFGFYSASARALDEILYAAPNYLVVSSAGNDRNDSVPAGTPHYFYDARAGAWRQSTKVRDNDGAPLGYDCLPNGSSLAKNALLVGAVKPVLSYTGPSSVEMTPYSSWGPTDDGRIKPDICGDGWAVYSSTSASDTSYEYYYGTSMASPNVCGSLGLLQDYYRDTHHGLPMRAATLKALAIHTAREAGPFPGPDYSFGWGLLDSYAAYRHIEADLDDRLGLIEELTLVEDAPVEFYYLCDGTESALRVTIAWTDPPGTPPPPALDPPTRMLVNDLDLRVEKDGIPFEPWTLDPSDPSAPAARGDNAVDNVEQVLIENPEAGIYVVRIMNDGALGGGTQDFSLIVSGATRTKTWHVYADGSGDAPTIAAAIDSAAAGDQILLYPGVHRGHDVVVDKGVAIKGMRGARYTIVDAERLGRCFLMPEGAGAVRLEGLTLRNGAAEGAGDAGRGGAILSRNGEASIVGCVVTGGRAARGGGLYVENGLSELKQCAIRRNAASEAGGGIFVDGADLSIDRCVVAWNTCAGDGGGVYVSGSSPDIAGCSFAYNAAGARGGSIYFTESSWATVSRTIVAFTLGGEGVYQDGSGGGIQFSCCDFYGNASGDGGGAAAIPAGDGEIVFADPQFCDAARDDFGVGDGSPCRPEGNPCGELIGAIGERCHTKTTWYVMADGSGDEPTIAAAVNRASPGDTIMLAAGVFTGPGNRDISFGGKNLVVRSESGPGETVIDCGASRGERHYGFYLQNGESSSSAIEGLTIRLAMLGGIRCFDASPVIRDCVIDSCITNGSTHGGAIYLLRSSSLVEGCTLTNNRANPTGGGVYCREYTGSIVDCTITGNSAVRYGGGIGVATSSTARIARCTVSGNTASGDHGGGIYIMSATAVIDTCVMSGNTGGFGGGLYNGLSSFCTIRRSILAGNHARQGGGGAYTSANMTMENCTVAGNSAAQYGGGIESFNGAQNPISGSIIASNLSNQGIYTVSGVQAISCSDVFGNAGGDYGGSTPNQTGLNGNFSVDPGFCNAAAQDYALYDTSGCAPERSPCGTLVGAAGVGCRIAPNLVIDAVDLGGASVEAGRSIAARIVVRNDGVVDADTFAVDFYAARETAPGAGDRGERRIVVPSLAVGDTVVWTTEAFGSDTIGAWRCWVAADPDGRLVETNESDNVSGPHDVSWTPPREGGWPVAAAGVVAPPLLVDLDGDPSTLEVVAGGADGLLRAWSAGGGPLDGWPVALGGAVRSAAAGGDIAGDSRNEIVVGCDDGKIYAFDAAGQKLWERIVSGSAPVLSTPALADLDGDGKAEVLCGAAGLLHVLSGTGDPFAGGWPLDLGSAEAGSPAVGDVDLDGDAEIAIVSWSGGEIPLSRVHLFSADGAPFGPAWPVTVDTLLVPDAMIGDVAGDHGRLEIVAVGTNGAVYAWNSDGSPSFPAHRVSGSIESSPALADLDGDGYLDVAVVSRRWFQEGEGGSWEGFASAVSGRAGVLFSERISQRPDDTGAIPGPICIGKPKDLFAGDPAGAVRALLMGLSVFMAAPIAASPAAGDMDGDGWIEIVVPTNDDSMRCYELRTPRVPVEALWWPLARRSAARTGSYGYEPVSGAGEDPAAAAPRLTAIRSIYPNPFNPSARIVFDVAKRSRVTIKIYDAGGREVAVIATGDLEAGRHETVWNGRTSSGAAAASGVYFCRLAAGEALSTRKLILMR